MSVFRRHRPVSGTTDRQDPAAGRTVTLDPGNHDTAVGHRPGRPRGRSDGDIDDNTSNTVPERATHSPRDTATGSDDRATDSSGRNPSTPAWVPTDNVITERPDRQVLVVGDTIVGLVLTLLLRRAGYDPLIVNGTKQSAPSRVTYLCPPVIRTLDAIGAGTSIQEYGTTVDSVSVHESSSQSDPTILSMEAEPAEMPLVVHTAGLHRALETRLPEQQRGGDRTIEAFSRRDSGLVVEFGDGIREWFDVVVDAGGGGDALRSARGESPSFDPLAQCEIAIDNDVLSGHQIRDHWHSDALVQAFQSPNGSGNLLRVTAPRSDIGNVLDDENLEILLPYGTDLVPERIEFEPTSVRQVRSSDATAEWWGTGQVAFCGPAACPVAPGSDFALTLGIEDAVAFVTELTGETPEVSDIVDTYSSRQADRLTTLRETIETADSGHQYPMPQSTQPPLASLGAFRAVTLGSFLGTPMASLQRDGFRAN